MNKAYKKAIDEKLLSNDFAYYADWEYGPISGWSPDYDHISLRLMEHDTGYYLIYGRHASGENTRMNLNSLNNADDIIKLRDLLKKCY